MSEVPLYGRCGMFTGKATAVQLLTRKSTCDALTFVVRINFWQVGQPPFPPETFGNLLLLYCKYQYYDLAADVMAVPYTLHPTPYTLHRGL